MTMIRNEQTKLTATFLNGLGIALFAVGGLAPSLGMANGSVPFTTTTFALTCYCYAASLALHLMASRILRKLEP